jgi:hypothetical protein
MLFEKAQFKRLFCDDLFEVTRFAPQFLHLVSICPTGSITRQPLITGFHEVYWPFVIDALENPLPAAQISNAVLATQTIQHDPDLLFRWIKFARGALDVLYDVRAGDFRCLSHLPPLGGYDQQQTLS